MRSFGMAASAAGLGFLAFALAACTHVPLLIAGMDAEDIQRVSDEMLCNSSAVFMHTRGRRFPNIEAEIDRRRLPCGDNEDVQVAEQESPVAQAPAPAPAAAPAAETPSRALQNANMRAGPGAGHAVVGSLRVGETVTVLRVVNGWCECRNGARRIVFIRCNLLTPPAGGWATLAIGGATTTPVFTQGARYPDVRRRLLAEGWSPFRLEGGAGCLPNYLSACSGFPETVLCTGTGQNSCWYTYRRGEEYLLVVGLGEFEGQGFGELRRCSQIIHTDDHPWTWCRPITTASNIRRSGRNLGSDGFGRVRIGMTPQQVSRALGIPLTPRGEGDSQECEGRAPVRGLPGLSFLFLGGRLDSVSIYGESRITTAEGIGIGATADEVRRAYGGRILERPHEFGAEHAVLLTHVVSDHRGILFEVDTSSGRVQTIRAGGMSIFYYEGCS